MRWYRSEAARDFAVATNDGIIATAGVLQGFAGAGATSTTLLVASLSALVAGSVASFGAKYAELAAARDAERALIAETERDILEDASDDLDDLAAYFVERGVPVPTAREVADHLHRHDAVGAQLEVEHGIDEPTPPSRPLLGGLLNAAAVATGSALPLLILLAYPAAWESWAVFVAVLISLAATSMLIALSAHTSVPRALRRTLAIGLATMGLSYLAGLVVF
ncbi:VIT1/CCC1 transporter family protein [Agromyces larvae]|uniref:VIT1/CCC1 transporter family protein n=1 Tax=Agromyces larvae TaxID=2929802 RepID=A0ABY4BXW4_9MICO|nr:VIT1/CCC1 transporter family protein [Agromyces larvae]UOE43037.1 VIT1/CCC1 transporter family protein [Agromyces larvae]